MFLAPPQFTSLENERKVFVLSDFTEDIQRLIHLLKYGGKTQVGTYLGGALGRQLDRHVLAKRDWVVVPVPLHSARKRERGYNQSAWIANAMAKEMQLTVRENVVKRIRHTPTQTHLTFLERQRNVSGVFKVINKDAVVGRKILLVDDVVTTGATALACADALMQNGASEVWVVAVARPALGDDGV